MSVTNCAFKTNEAFLCDQHHKYLDGEFCLLGLPNKMKSRLSRHISHESIPEK
jgi:hypothetical protein